MMRKSCMIALLAIVISLGATAQKKRDLSIPLTMSYMLPKTAFQVEVEMECLELVPGPFYMYAEQQLGERPEITARGQQWRIKNIRLVQVPVADEKNVFQVTVMGDYAPVLFQLTPEGFLAGVGLEQYDNKYKKAYQWKGEQKNEEKVDYLGFGIRSTQKEVLDSNFTDLEVDGVIRQVWDPIERYELKQREEYVQEITDELFGIREKRLNLLSGKQGAPVTGEALKALKELEDNYLSLFMGKKIPRKVVRKFTFIPEKEGEAITLFRFSEAEGITARNNVSAQPFVLEIKNIVVPKEENQQKGRAAAGITYYVPAVGDVVLSKGNEKLLEERCIISQLGYTKSFPLEVIGNEGYSLEFYPDYGSLKSVIKNR